MTELQEAYIRVAKFRDQQIINLIEEHASQWRPGSAAVHVAEYFQRIIRAMPTPVPVRSGE